MIDPLALPWVRVGAYAVITDDAARILLCRIAPGYPEGGKWTLPGGGVDHGEHPDHGVVREVAEETGLVARVGPVASVESGLIPRPASRPGPLHWIAILYHVAVEPAPLRQEIGGSTEVCAWIDQDQVPSLARVSLVDRAIESLRTPRSAMSRVAGSASTITGEDPFGPGDPKEVARVARRALAAGGRRAAEVDVLVLVTDRSPPANDLARFTRRALGPQGGSVRTLGLAVGPDTSHDARSATAVAHIRTLLRDPARVGIGVVLGPGPVATAVCVAGRHDPAPTLDH
ncbi:MAG: NUDIX domain-containing protein [Thermoleophilia bacterium]|nr:NUDIX domain-containing protein [Thermoleophilia bacterium]